MTEETMTDLSVTGGDNLSIVPEELEVDLHDREDNEGSSSAIQDSGRMIFRGQDMLFLKVNGVQMLTFYEIMRKLCPETKRGNYSTVFTSYILELYTLQKSCCG